MSSSGNCLKCVTLVEHNDSEPLLSHYYPLGSALMDISDQFIAANLTHKANDT